MVMALLRTEFLTFCAWGDCVCVNVCLSGLVLVRVLRYSSQDAGVVGAVIVIAVVDITDVAWLQHGYHYSQYVGCWPSHMAYSPWHRRMYSSQNTILLGINTTNTQLDLPGQELHPPRSPIRSASASSSWRSPRTSCCRCVFFLLSTTWYFLLSFSNLFWFQNGLSRASTKFIVLVADLYDGL